MHLVVQEGDVVYLLRRCLQSTIHWAHWQSAYFLPIPRGGLIVLGHLSYLLNLSHDQLDPANLATARRVVIVDDCSLSGARFAKTLDSLPDSVERVVFLHLLSTPALRRAILEAEPRVEACIAGGDLAEIPTDDTFRTAWAERLPGKRYWLGRVEPFSFPWGEPDQVLWNEREGRVEDDWHRASPLACLEAETHFRLPWPEDGTRTPRLDLAPGVVWRADGENLLLWQSERDEVLGLEGTAPDFLRALLAFGSLDRALDHLEDRYEAEREQLRGDLIRFEADLLERGLVRRLDGEPGEPGVQDLER